MDRLWRPFFLIAGVLILIGGPLHPNGTMAEMLAHPDWVLSHALMTVGFVALGMGLALYRRAAHVASRTARWSRIALYATILQAIEMALHTASTVDHANLVAGRATPVLSAHLTLTVVVYPLFAAAIIAWIVAATRDRALGSRWIAWIGIVGAAAHGLAALLVVVLGIERAVFLFPMIVLLALWLVLVAVWPLGETRSTPAACTA